MWKMVELEYWDLGGVVCLVLLAMLLSRRLKAGVEGSLLVGLVRSFVQLVAVGYVLMFLFGKLRSPGWVLLALLVMIGVASIDGMRRTEKKLPARGRITFVSISLPVLVGLVVTMVTSLSQVVFLGDWYEPRYLIPLGGMAIAQALNSTALAVDRVCAELGQQRQRIESALALGATARQAVSGIIRATVRAAMLPATNLMMIIGVVQIPGMMSGMILNGAKPQQAVVYQLVVVYMIVGVSALSSLMAAHLTFRVHFTSAHQLRGELVGMKQAGAGR